MAFIKFLIEVMHMKVFSRKVQCKPGRKKQIRYGQASQLVNLSGVLHLLKQGSPENF